MENMKKRLNNEKGASKYVIIAILTLVLVMGIWTAFEFMSNRQPDKKSEESSQAKKTAPTAKPEPKKKTESHAPKKQKSKTIKTHGVSKSSPSRAFTSPKGITFIEACIEPLEHELEDRFWGWRPNDVINITDNVNNFQLGVLEVTRRTTVALVENISRTGKSDAYVPSLEYAMNWFMIKPTKYWFPSAESKYKEGLEELKNYMNMVKNGEAGFYRRVDNLVPLLKSYESILGSCDENLVKDLGELSYFTADDRLYYSQGVASAMIIILEAVAKDFGDTIISVQGEDVLHHAISSLEHAAHVDPILVLEGQPDGLTANHRANMAASISHARFYLGVLNTALTGNI